MNDVAISSLPRLAKDFTPEQHTAVIQFLANDNTMAQLRQRQALIREQQRMAWQQERDRGYADQQHIDAVSNLEYWAEHTRCAISLKQFGEY